jgi:lincosamide nucleotidyltransferase
MNEKLMNRLNDLGKHLYIQDYSLALLALGSCAEVSRMDEYSDLDFFLIVKEGTKTEALIDLSWLEVAPLSYTFRNTIDGYKVMWEDGIYAEFALFEPEELASISFSPGRFIFKKKGTELSSEPTVEIKPQLQKDRDYAVNEILTNLYVGLCRYRRGEVLSAFRLISVHAVDRYLSILPLLDQPKDSLIDPFALDRRIEERHPGYKTKIASYIQGYDGVLESAQALLDELETITTLNPVMKREINTLMKKQA